MKPVRIQRKRVKGWKMPENTVYVGRGSKWENPIKIKIDNNFLSLEYPGQGLISYFNFGNYKEAQKKVCELYRKYIQQKTTNSELDITELKGKNLACWCPLDQPYHADVLLELANE